MPARPGSVSFVLGMDSDGRVPQHGFGPGGRDDETLSRIVRRAEVIYEVPISYHGRSYEEGKKIRGADAASVVWMIFKRRLFR